MNDFLRSIWPVIEPLVMTLLTIVGPALVTWLSVRIVGLLKIKEDTQKAEVEQKMRDALHLSAENAIKLIIGQALSSGVTSSPLEAIKNLSRDEGALNKVINYVQDKNPDAVKTFELTGKGILDIAISKIPDVLAAIAAKRLSPSR